MNFPPALLALPQWACATGKPAKGDPSGKRPRNPHNGRPASATDPSTWGTFEQAVAAAIARGWNHVGVVLTANDPFAIVDLDDKAARPATTEERAHFDQIVREFDSYTERSSSGRGLHIVVEASLSKGLHRGTVEVYSSERFMISTGDVVVARPVGKRQSELDSLVARIAPAPTPAVASPALPASLADAEVLERIEREPTGAELLRCTDFLALGYESQSSADLALMNLLARYSADEEQCFRLFRSVPLGQRDKAQRDDYLRRTLDRARESMPIDAESAASLFSDYANAQRIVHHLGKWLLFAPGIGWHVWDGSRWRNDPLEARRHAQRLGQFVMQDARSIIDKAAKLTNRDEAERERELAEKLLRFAGQSENVGRTAAAMTASEPLLRCDPDRLDANPWLLGCANGVVDLRTGGLMIAAPEQLITKSTGVAYSDDSGAPMWQAFLRRTFPDTPELVGFLQKLAGYWLTGLTDPPFLSVLYGIGANGKSTLVNAISNAMGDYAAAAPPGLLMARYGERHPTELAMLQGRRFVAAAESGEGGRLDEEKVKMLTGSDRISARRMREDFFDFQPTHKLALMTNHKPMVRGMDEGIWRRLVLIPFEQVIPPDERDPNLVDKLRAESAGILRWMVEGARQFHEDGSRLTLPASVAQATRDYRTESDVLGEFISEVCVEGSRDTIASSALYAAYDSWCRDNGERVMTKTTFGLRLKDKGFASAKDSRGTRTWKGLRLRLAADERAKHRRQAKS
ncbi:MAG: phage/plasmid primase, P4 family [Luteimonas sp.]